MNSSTVGSSQELRAVHQSINTTFDSIAYIFNIFINESKQIDSGKGLSMMKFKIMSLYRNYPCSVSMGLLIINIIVKVISRKKSLPSWPERYVRFRGSSVTTSLLSILMSYLFLVMFSLPLFLG